MMRNPVLIASFFVLGACSVGNSESRAEGPTVTRNFAVGGFDAVELAGSDTVLVVRGAVPSVVASGPADVLDRLEIDVEGKTLTIKRKRSAWRMGWNKSSGATITVTTPGIKAAALAGSGDLRVDHATGDQFTASLAGSGDLDLADVRVNRVNLELAGSGDLHAAGAVQSASLEIAGSGDIDALRLVSRTADVSIAGSGGGQVTARESAKISIAGSGEATVRGTKNCTISKVGSGQGRCEP